MAWIKEPLLENLSQLAFSGVDPAFIELINRSKLGQQKLDYIKSAVRWKPRYKKILEDQSNINFVSNRSLLYRPSKFLLNLPIKVCVYQNLNPRLRNRIMKLPITLTVKSLLDSFTENSNVSKELIEIKNDFKDYNNEMATALMFHNAILKHNEWYNYDKDNLTYIFDENYPINKIRQRLYLIDDFVHPNQFVERICNEEGLNEAIIRRLSQDLIRTISLKSSQRDILHRIIITLGERLNIYKKKYHYLNPDFPKALENISIFCFIPYLNSDSMIKKIHDLDRCGIRVVRDMILILNNWSKIQKKFRKI